MTQLADGAEVERLELATRRLVRDLLAGDVASAFRGRGVEFADVRPYQAGDDARAIDWRVTARRGEPHVRLQQEERELTLVLAIDTSPSLDVGSRRLTKRRLAAEVGAALALAAARAHGRVGSARLGGARLELLPARKGRRHALHVVQTLLAPGAPRGEGFAGALAELEPRVGRHAFVVVLSDFQSAGWEEPLARVGQRRELLAVQVTDTLESALPDAGLVTLRDPATGRTWLVDSGDPALRAHLAARRAGFDARVERGVAGAGGQLLRLDAALPYAEPLIAWFRRRARGG